MLDGGKWSKKNEEMVLSTRDLMIKQAIEPGFNVVVDDTNLHPKHEHDLRYGAQLLKAEFEIDDSFCKVSVHECLRRDRARPNPVGDEVILQMWNRYLKPKPVEWTETKPSCYIFDIDGTLAKMNGRGPYEWDKVGTDTPNEPVVSLLQILKQHKNVEIVIVSGRDGSCREETVAWLRGNGMFYKELHMRTAGDNRKDYVVKSEIADELIKRWNILGVFDDRDQVVAMWRERGIPCFQVDYGAF